MKRIIFCLMLALSTVAAVTVEASFVTYHHELLRFEGSQPERALARLRELLPEVQIIEKGTIVANRLVRINVARLSKQQALGLLSKIIKKESKCDLLKDRTKESTCLENAEKSADMLNSGNWYQVALKDQQIAISGVGLAAEIPLLSSEQFNEFLAAFNTISKEIGDEAFTWYGTEVFLDLESNIIF